MTVEEITERIELINKVRYDYEKAHGMEDDLRDDVLSAIASGASNARELANEVLKTSDIRFPRYSA